MAYCTITDLYSVEPIENIARLSNDTHGSVINEDCVNAIIISNSNIIDGYVRGRYPLDKVVSDPVLKKVCIELTIHDLYYRRNKSSMPENIVKSKDSQYSILKSIQRAELVLDIDDTDLRPIHFAVDSPAQIFTDSIMEDYRG